LAVLVQLDVQPTAATAAQAVTVFLQQLLQPEAVEAVEE
jgi:hypothetical protein